MSRDIRFAKFAKDAKNTNFAKEFIDASNDEDNNSAVQGKANIPVELLQREDETQAEYNERVPMGSQPVQPMSNVNYLGQEV